MNDLAEQQAKRALRQEFLQRRRQLAAAEAAAASAEICRRLSACLAERLRPEQPGAVFSYLAYGREVDLAALHQELWRNLARRKRWRRCCCRAWPLTRRAGGWAKAAATMTAFWRVFPRKPC